MAEEKWEKVVDSIESDEWTFDEDKHKELVGTFLAKKEDVGPNNSNIYYVENKEGTFSFWGKTMLDVLLKGIEAGEDVKIVYTGMKTPKKGGKDYFSYEVFHRKPAFTKIKEEEIPELEEEINPKKIPF